MATIPPSGTPIDTHAGLTKRQQQQGRHSPTVFTRLQGLLSPHPHTPGYTGMTRPGDSLPHNKYIPTPTTSTTPRRPLDPKFLKIRLLTWNMHDSLPKGDLEELLGKVPLYTGPTVPQDAFPQLLNDGNHPYHLIVIAGQECPTPSGIPKGLGAGFKILDKDRDKSKEFDKELDKATSKSNHKHDDSRSHRQEDDLEGPPSGWTSIVEDWLCNGSGYGRTGSPTTADVGFPRPLIRQKSSKDARKGPYQLLIKDRLMGIYMAIYIHRDLKPFVRGMSKSAVTAGLIGGRVGNKGGVGISLNIDGTTLLFLNAHLAAHEGKVHHRLANLAKIKSELSVDDFLSADNPRKMAEDLTDRFDFSFLCGDLNFRLNLSRLHADWLIAHEAYAQAFEFDQLHAIMKDGNAFSGFHEAPIKFPPTFKYDVLRSIRRSRRSGSKYARADDRFIVSGSEERDMQDEDDADEDNVSITSTGTGATSMHSQMISDPAADDFRSLSSLPTTPTSRVNSASKISIASVGAHKAKLKLLSLLSPSFSNPNHKLLRAKSNPDSPIPSTPTMPNLHVPPSPLAASLPTKILENGKKPRPPPMILVKSPTHIEDDIPVEKGVYDSSSKKRVPSWCDRILWKTTIEPPPPRIGEGELYSPDPDPHRPRNRMGHFLANAFRSPPSRGDSTPTSAAIFSDQATPTFSSALSPGIRGRIASSPNPEYRLPTSNTPSKQPDSRTRRVNTAFSPPSTAPLYSEWPASRHADDHHEASMSVERPQSATYAKWLGFLPSFFSPTHAQGPTQDSLHPHPMGPTPPTRGTVVCLGYDTLDDRGMRRLEGRSDHRPVVGAYIVYI